MSRFQNVLFPTDFSECSEKVFPYALDWVKKFEARLHLLFVARDLSYLKALDVSSDLLLQMSSEIVQVGKNQMKHFCTEYLKGFENYTTEVVIGDPKEAILKYADQTSIDLIIIATHGRKDVDRLLIGSVADHVVKNANVPVITINPFKSNIWAYIK